MILRRITKHVTDQNWFAVFLDFIIVVVGILIAFQINHWDTSRQDNLIYDQARTRVIEEALANLDIAQEAIIKSQAYKLAAKEIIIDFETCQSSAGTVQRLKTAIQNLRFVISFKLIDDAIQLILTSDAFLDNISPTDRNVLSIYAHKLDSLEENLYFSDRYQLGRKSLQDNPNFIRTLTTEIDRGLVGINLNASYEDICTNSAFNTFLFDKLENATYILVQAESLEKATVDVLLGLGEDVSEKLIKENIIDLTSHN